MREVPPRIVLMGAKHVPTRTCIACGATRSKRELVRIVRTPQGEVVADSTGRRAGRGAYLDPNESCLQAGLSGGKLARALETAIPDEVQVTLREDVVAIARDRARGILAGSRSRASASAGGVS